MWDAYPVSASAPRTRAETAAGEALRGGEGRSSAPAQEIPGR